MVKFTDECEVSVYHRQTDGRSLDCLYTMRRTVSLGVEVPARFVFGEIVAEKLSASFLAKRKKNSRAFCLSVCFSRKHSEHLEGLFLKDSSGRLLEIVWRHELFQQSGHAPALGVKNSDSNGFSFEKLSKHFG